METSALVSYDVRRCDKALAERNRTLWENAVNRVVDDVWATLVERDTGFPRLDPLHKDKLTFTSLALPSYTAPPPSYHDAVVDLPPDYATLPLLAKRKADVDGAPAAPGTRSRNRASELLKDRELDAYIDWENPVGVREHKKKKAGGGNAKKVNAPPPPADNGGSSDNPGEDPPAGDGGGDAGGGDGSGDGDGGGGGDDGWNDWTASGSKKKKKTEEEEEEERKAAEAAAGNNLSWADDMDEGGGPDDSWAEFGTVGGKKKKGKVSLDIAQNLEYV
jgi:hypothetical protein